MPANTVKVDRTTRWGNPFIVGKDNPFAPGQIVADRKHAFELYNAYMADHRELSTAARSILRSRNLACWCPIPAPGEEDYCHASVLLRIANA